MFCFCLTAKITLFHNNVFKKISWFFFYNCNQISFPVFNPQQKLNQNLLLLSISYIWQNLKHISWTIDKPQYHLPWVLGKGCGWFLRLERLWLLHAWIVSLKALWLDKTLECFYNLSAWVISYFSTQLSSTHQKQLIGTF